MHLILFTSCRRCGRSPSIGDDIRPFESRLSECVFFHRPQQALRDVPEVNSAWMGDFIRQYDSIDVSVAVQTPNGLMVPVVRNTDQLGLQDINAAVKKLAAKVGPSLSSISSSFSFCSSLFLILSFLLACGGQRAAAA